MISDIAFYGSAEIAFLSFCRLGEYFRENPEYTGVRYWVYSNQEEKIKECASLFDHNIIVLSFKDIISTVESFLPMNVLDKERERFLKKPSQKPSYKEEDQFRRFINRYFPGIPFWYKLDALQKYSGDFPPPVNISPYVHFENGEESPFFVVCTDSFSEEGKVMWGETKWGAIIRYVSSMYKHIPIFIIGDKKEHTYFCSKIRRVKDLRGKLSVTDKLSYVAGSSVFFGQESIETLFSIWIGKITQAVWWEYEKDFEFYCPIGMNQLKNLIFMQKAKKTDYSIRAFQELAKGTLEYAKSFV